jgi:hypothetical protein
MHAPERVERLVALSVGHPTAFGTAGLAQRLRSFYMALFMVRGLAGRILTMGDWFFMPLSTSNRELVAQWRADFAVHGRRTAALNYYRAAARIGGAFRLQSVTMPVLGMWSSGDTALAEGQMRNWARYVDAPFRYERIDGADHWLQLGAPALTRKPVRTMKRCSNYDRAARTATSHLRRHPKMPASAATNAPSASNAWSGCCTTSARTAAAASLRGRSVQRATGKTPISSAPTRPARRSSTGRLMRRRSRNLQRS